MTSIAPGGCYPSDWPAPPTCWPPHPPAPEPDPGSLDAAVDWMTYTHHELHDMVHNGLDLTGAMEVSAQWARLGAELAEIGAALGKIVEQSATAWQGEAADLARQTIAGLTNWAADSGAQATQVSGCVTIEVDNATNARDEMPAPPYSLTDLPTPEPRPLFTTGDWVGAGAITADPAAPLANEKALHQQAARAMARFQESSREVYGTVPQFASPQVGNTLWTGPALPPVPPPPTTPQGPITGGPALPPPLPGAPGAPGSTGVPGSAAAPGRGAIPTPPPPGPTTGTAEPAAAQNKPAAAAAGQGRPGQPGVGGMPMGGGAGAGREDDTERRTPDYLKENEDVWGMGDTPTMPSVIGEDRRRA